MLARPSFAVCNYKGAIMSLFRKKSKTKESPLPRSSSGSAYYLSRKEISGLMERSSTASERADNQAAMERVMEADDNARPDVIMRSNSSGPGGTRGQLETAQGTFMFSPEGLQLMTANTVQPAGPDPSRGLQARLAEATPTPNDDIAVGSPIPAALQDGGGVVQAMQPPDAREMPDAVTPNAGPQPPVNEKAGGASVDGKKDLLAESVSPDTLDSMLLEAGQESKAEPSRRTLFSIPVKQGPAPDVSMEPPSPGVAAALRLQVSGSLRLVKASSSKK